MLLSTADDIAVVEVQPQRVDRQIALQERLLVNRPLHSAGFDRVDKLRVGAKVPIWLYCRRSWPSRRRRGMAHT